jgi:hypothetical protein
MSEAMEVGLLAAGAALAGGILSGVYQHCRDWISRPKLQIEFAKNQPPNKVESGWEEDGKHIERVIAIAGFF